MKNLFLHKDRIFRVVLFLAAVFAAMNFSASAVVLTNIYSFGVFTNGAFPQCTLVQGSDGYFYGTTHGGGTNGGNGTVFKVNTSGSMVLLHVFTGGNDGAQPWCGLTAGNDGNFYGVTGGGGTSGYGTIFKITPTGSFTPLYSFTGGSDGGNPQSALTLGTNGLFYGTTIVGGTAFGLSGYGTVFDISPGGTFNRIYAFTGGSNGSKPYGGLVQGNDGYFYGTTYTGGGGNQAGTVFKMSATGSLIWSYILLGNVGGAEPYATMVQGTNGLFYGTTYGGGYYNRGLVFDISSAGAYSVLFPFNTNDPANPYSGLVQGSDGYFYGTAFYGGSNGWGGVFKFGPYTYTNLYAFTSGLDGAAPWGGLVQGTDGNFYGTTAGGGINGLGGVFSITSTGQCTRIFSFPGIEDSWGPEASLTIGSDGNFYGTTAAGGTNNWGGIFKISPGGYMTNLYFFTGGNDGATPNSALIQGNDGNFYGTTFQGGTNNLGTVFKIGTNGGLVSLYSFTGGNDGELPRAGLDQGTDGWFYGTTSSGANTSVMNTGALVQGADGNFYGTASAGGADSSGTVFKISASGSFSNLYSFTGGTDGGSPFAGLCLGSDGNFYGTAAYGGYGVGTIFRINPANNQFTNLYSFTAGDDGALPDAPLIEGNDGNYYSTVFYAGAYSYGTVFEISPNRTFTSLYSFTGGNDGSLPEATLVQGFDGNFYGTTVNGGIGGRGVVFCMSLGLNPDPVILTSDGKFGVHTNSFCFDVDAINSSKIVIEGCTNLGDVIWTPLATNTLNGIISYFNDPAWITYPTRFYRVQSP
jgi:uncharacterized repeat protein (TIGR03803 family)